MPTMLLGTPLAIAVALICVAPSTALAQARCPSIQALDGSCADPALVDTVRKRSTIVSSSFGSYFGTPAGTVGSPLIPYERLFRDDVTRFGLPTTTQTSTFTLICDAPCVGGTFTNILRSK
jgi:hypothetical protein